MKPRIILNTRVRGIRYYRQGFLVGSVWRGKHGVRYRGRILWWATGIKCVVRYCNGTTETLEAKIPTLN